MQCVWTPSPPPCSNLDPAAELPFVQNLRRRLQLVAPPPVRFHGDPPVQLPTDLSVTDCVFVRHDTHRDSLQAPYDGLFLVLDQNPKFLILDLNGKPDSVSVDRLKVAHGVSAADVPVHRRRGRPPNVRPARLSPNLAIGDPPCNVNQGPNQDIDWQLPQPLAIRPQVTRAGRVTRPPANFTHFVTHDIYSLQHC
ncbi:hypothetical protein TCAL_14476 [Tigriopus californicus]|uniref:Uncharacterized protein n=1 Tax=Tigriopus californicus TaxID=6832 RepID=A0A553PTT0_TIGCA|nr:hypothetical protein TCAL_14476 [Tigriopus californicus]